MAKELYSSGIHERLGEQYWKVTRTYAVSNAAARATEDSLYGKPHPGYPALYAPLCWRIRRQENWLPNTTKLTAYYSSPRGWRVPGRATLFIRLGSRPEDAKFDHNGLQLKDAIHTSDSTDGWNYARVTRGSNSILRPQTFIELHTAYERSAFSARKIAETMEKVGKVNKYRLRNFGDFPPGTLLLRGAPTSHVWSAHALWYVNYSFVYEPKGWNNLTKRQVFTKLPKIAPVLDETGAVSAKTREVMVEIAKEITSIDADGNVTLKPTQEEDTVMYETTSFRELDAMVKF